MRLRHLSALRNRLPLIAAALACLAGPAAAQSDPIHADLPLWTEEGDEMWPRQLDAADGIGCAHILKLGDWRYDGPQGDDAWVRLANYGAMHCYILESRADAREQLGGREPRYSRLIGLGRAQGRGEPVELWALQSGGRPGSDYTLLATRGASMEAFDVLSVDCPAEAVRETAPIDILGTRYCAINSRAALIDLARRMAKLAPAGRLTFVGAAK